MKEMERSGGHRTTSEWHVRLDCGHVVSVPWGSAGPAVMAYVMAHRDGCPPAHLALPGDDWRTLPITAPRPAPF